MFFLAKAVFTLAYSAPNDVSDFSSRLITLNLLLSTYLGTGFLYSHFPADKVTRSRSPSSPEAPTNLVMINSQTAITS